MRTSELMMWQRSVTPQNILQTLLADPSPWFDPTFTGKCGAASEADRRQERARSSPLPSQAQLPRTDLPGRCLRRIPSFGLYQFTHRNSAPLGPAYPPSLPAGREEWEVPRKSGRDSLPRPSRPKAYLRGEALSRPSGPGMPEVSPTLHSRRENKFAPCACTPTASRSRDRTRG